MGTPGMLQQTPVWIW